MEYGVFTSKTVEIVQTRMWAICLYMDVNREIMGAKLYHGIDDDKKLIGICEQNNDKCVYAYQMDGQSGTNDYDGVRALIGNKYVYDMAKLRKIEDIEITQHIKMPSVSEAGIETCLRLWRMGTTLHSENGFLHFQIITNKIEYIFMIHGNNCDIYCGASVNVPANEGLWGSGQYFRLRNVDGSEGFRQFYCDLGNEINVPSVPKEFSQYKTWTQTSCGNFWTVKRQSDNEIVLDGCGGGEYIYRQDNPRNEFFICSQ